MDCEGGMGHKACYLTPITSDSNSPLLRDKIWFCKEKAAILPGPSPEVGFFLPRSSSRAVHWGGMKRSWEEAGVDDATIN